MCETQCCWRMKSNYHNYHNYQLSSLTTRILALMIATKEVLPRTAFPCRLMYTICLQSTFVDRKVRDEITIPVSRTKYLALLQLPGAVHETEVLGNKVYYAKAILEFGGWEGIDWGRVPSRSSNETKAIHARSHACMQTHNASISSALSLFLSLTQIRMKYSFEV